ETAWWSNMNESPDIVQDQSGHFTMQLRHYPESIYDAHMVTSMASLAAHESSPDARILETAHPTTEQIHAFFEQLSDAFLKIPLAMIQYGVCPEFHAQHVG
ncbi:siderophore biosynthesis protein SbnC, partial [Staphylococcus pseudintermedius]